MILKYNNKYMMIYKIQATGEWMWNIMHVILETFTSLHVESAISLRVFKYITLFPFVNFTIFSPKTTDSTIWEVLLYLYFTQIWYWHIGLNSHWLIDSIYNFEFLPRYQGDKVITFWYTNCEQIVFPQVSVLTC